MTACEGSCWNMFVAAGEALFRTLVLGLILWQEPTRWKTQLTTLTWHNKTKKTS